MEIRKIITKLIHIASSFLFPKNCIGCRKNNVFLCSQCANKIKLDNYQIQPDIFALFPYTHPDIQDLIHRFKYQGVFTIAKDLIEVVIKDIEMIVKQEFIKDKKKIILLPIPLSHRRYRQRGYNQSLKLAQAIIKKQPEKFELLDKVLIKIKNNQSQVEIKDKNKRCQNIIDAFAIIKPELVKNRQVIIIDDVVTTGATITEAMKKVKQAGAQKVIGLAVAQG
jgi:competence protein ComFC